MGTIVILSLSFALSCSDQSIPSWVSHGGPGVREFWKEVSVLDLDRDLVRELMESIDQEDKRKDLVQGLIRSCKENRVDIVAFVQQMVQNQVLPKGSGYWDVGISEMDLLRWLPKASDPCVDEWILNFARSKFAGSTVKSWDDSSYLTGLLRVVGATKRDNALEFLLLVQSEAFWNTDSAPTLELSATENSTVDEASQSAKNVLRQEAVRAISESGAERAIEILGTGKDIAPDLQGMLDDCFLVAVRRHVGIYGFAEWRGAKLSKAKLAEIKKIYAKYGKEYTPLKENKRMRNISPPHHP